MDDNVSKSKASENITDNIKI